MFRELEDVPFKQNKSAATLYLLVNVVLNWVYCNCRVEFIVLFAVDFLGNVKSLVYSGNKLSPLDELGTT